jgi:hypothetical protein
MKSCRFYLDGAHDYIFQVTLLPNRKQYLVYSRSKTINDIPSSGKDSAAKCFTFTMEQLEKDRIFADLVFYPEYFDEECIAHEVAHMALRWFLLTGRDVYVNEEEFAALVGQAVQHIMIWRNDLATVADHTTFLGVKQAPANAKGEMLPNKMVGCCRE